MAHYLRPQQRQPFSNALNHNNAALPPPPPPKQEKPPASPPLPRQNNKTLPPSPPQVIKDASRNLHFNRVGFLGEGGFARVYEAQDARGFHHAIKVVTKNSLKTKKAKTKLYAEIKIHRSLSHPNIVRFGECFEDSENVYMTLELCQSGSLMDTLRRRRRFTEPEVRFFVVQLAGACDYMHTHQVIHRDLKLGNLFLDRDMNVKVGDFGLAALIENPGERKKTICGTPNYIAPEVLFDTANGHSFEVDIWSIGVILYTLIIGRPPFQTKDVKTIYKRIRENQYEFPTDREVSHHSRDLIQQILTLNPQERPSLHEILDHPFFTLGTVPAFIPVSAHEVAPDFRHVTRSMSLLNLATLRKRALLDDDQVTSIALPMAGGKQVKTGSIAQQEREFQKAVQPSSPISALLNSARQPLMVVDPRGEREPPLIRKLQAAAKERDMQNRLRSPAKAMVAAPSSGSALPLGHSMGVNGVNGMQGVTASGLQDIREEEDEEYTRKKELASQKARIVAQMVPGEVSPVMEEDQDDDAENVPPPNQMARHHQQQHHHQHTRATRIKEKDIAVVREEMEKGLRASTADPSNGGGSGSGGIRLSGFDTVAQTLSVAFDAKAKGRVFRDPRDDEDLPDAKVFIVSWVDYCNKYGMGYALTDGSVGVHFNDSTTIILSPDKNHFDYITSRRSGAAYARRNYTVSEYPDDLKSKVYLLKHFERYIMDRLYGEYSYTFEDKEKTRGMEFVQKYLRMKQVIVFRLSHDVLQFNFYDHTKVILSSQGLLVTYISKDYEMTRYSLSEVMHRILHPPMDEEEGERKFYTRLGEKLKYCRDVLVNIKNAGEKEGLGASTRTEAR